MSLYAKLRKQRSGSFSRPQPLAPPSITNDPQPLAATVSSVVDENTALLKRDERIVDEEVEQLCQSLLAVDSDDEEKNTITTIRRSLRLPVHPSLKNLDRRILRLSSGDLLRKQKEALEAEFSLTKGSQKRQKTSIGALVIIVLIFVGIMIMLLVFGEVVVGPPRNPVGRYKLIDVQKGASFFDESKYTFYEGPDSAGSDGYINYVSKKKAFESGIAKILTSKSGTYTSNENDTSTQNSTDENMIYMSSAATSSGPRDSIRLEGKRRFNRGLFIIDLDHMPAGCGTWPAFWLTDETNWPVNGEIDILEGVNFQTEAKTALHSTQTCSMDDVPLGVKTGKWDTAVGVPNGKTGKPDWTMRYAKDCYVYSPHQWLNQGCVAVDKPGTIGEPFNKNGGGVYVLEWDPINRHIRSWIFTPHTKVPDNLNEAMRTSSLEEDERTDPDPNLWGLPYAYFAIGDNTSCPSSHFKNMRLVINLAFCGSVAGNRYFMDCPDQMKKYPTCNEYIKSNPKELDEAYWKIRGVYIYEREWENRWV